MRFSVHFNQSTRIILLVALALLALLGNYQAFPLFFRVEFLFGSIATLIALQLLGRPPAILVAVVGSLYTLLVWGHPYALIIALLEVAVVGMLSRSLVRSIVAADILYWTFLGAPLSILFYAGLMGAPSEQAALIGIKHALNGVFNAIVASMLLSVLVLYQRGSGRGIVVHSVSLRNLVLNILITSVFLPSLALIVYQNRNALSEVQSALEDELTLHARFLKDFVSTGGREPDLPRIRQMLEVWSRGDGMHTSLLRADGTVLLSTTTTQRVRSLLGTGRQTVLEGRLVLWVPPGTMPEVVRWNEANYFVHEMVGVGEIGSVLVQVPAAESLQQLERTYLEAFRLLGGITLLTLLLGPVASHFLVRPLRQLSEVSRDVPAKLMHATPIDWPVSGVSEFARLTENIRLMATSLGRTFAELRTARDELERRVEERTASLKESAARTQAIVDNAVEGIITIDEEGLVESFNPAAERIFGYSAGEVLGRNVSMLMPEPYHTGHNGYIRRYLETGEQRVMKSIREAEGRRKDGTVFPLELAVSEVPFPDRHLFTGIVRDISERKKMDRMKSEFISTVSHELRTPLTSIRGSLGLVIGGVSGELPEQARGLIEIANKNSERLSRLINDILDVEKIESGRMAFDIRPVALLPIIEQVIEANEAYASQYGAHIVLKSAQEGLSVLADPDRLTQVFTNLLSNAAKFSPQGGTVNVTVVENAGEVRVAISDAGAGIPEEFRSHVFEKFSQADASDSRRSGGTGLGLSIAKAIVDRLGGRIDFESVPGSGTTFTVDLPLWSGPGTQIFSRRPPGVRGQERGISRVLVCEDDPDVGTLLRLMLEQEGYRADIATSLGQARTLLAKERYAAMTLDIMLPDGNGLELLHELRRDERTAGLPVIIVSAVADVHRQEVDGEALAVVDWLRKPIDQEQLIQAVQRAASGPRPRILHVEDDPDVQRVVGDILRDFAQVEVANNRADAESALEQGGFSLLILDLELPDGSGLSLLPMVGRFQPPVPVVIFSAHEQDHVLADEVAAALVKSRTTNHELVATIRGILGEHRELPASPDGHPERS